MNTGKHSVVVVVVDDIAEVWRIGVRGSMTGIVKAVVGLATCARVFASVMVGGRQTCRVL